MSHHDISHIKPLHLRARLAFMEAAHFAEVGAAQYEMEARSISPAMKKCISAILLGDAERARARAAEHAPCPVAPVKPWGERLN